MGFQAGNVSNRHQAEEAHRDSQSGWDLMQTMSLIEIKQRYTRLTFWMGFYACHVSDRNQAEEVHTTHALDGFHVGNISDRNQAEEAQSDSQSG